ncbi:luciferin 4-monooxygenase-like isoform X2 [Plodia interpunctella]|nr:luciferin 4-monooxygenase-like isoform X2 [Plodia interpunctella]XP_053617141.1 luciferin 4-monooxygenase-like isoform X2 [Plodia interpunctella]XP_053617142.1 luciferin 4-monooxygenase-like isoform X2 [Plodia interpunctella]
MGIPPKTVNDLVMLFMNDLTSRIVAQTGNPEDRFHLGKIILQSFKDAPDFIMQIDGLTGETVTFAQALERTVRCARAFRSIGLKTGDVMVLMSPNYSDLAIAFYAALYEGVIISPVDMGLGAQEIKNAFEVNKPKIVLCHSSKAGDVEEALKAVKLDSPIVLFDKGDQFLTFPEFMKKYTDDSPIESYKTRDFEPKDTVAILVATSGTTGLPKSAACTHKNLAIVQPYLWSRFTSFPTPTRLAMVCTTLQWMTALMNYLTSPIMRFTRLQSSAPMIPDHAYDLINKYRPTFTIMSPTLMSSLLTPGLRDRCDFSSFEVILLSGSAVHQELINEIEKVIPTVQASICYGMSELSGIGFHSVYPARGACGHPLGCFQFRLIDVETLKDIHEPRVNGELWAKGPGIINTYYNNPEATKLTYAEDGWFKTGDLFYRDEHSNYYFVERIKLLLKYKNHQISPVEVEGVILQHPGVMDAVVVGVPEPSSGELAVACVIRRPGCDVTASEIKQLVKKSLADSKQLRGGVIFLDSFPTTATSKVHRMKLKQMALTMHRE